jgi:hypothetical protein
MNRLLFILLFFVFGFNLNAQKLYNKMKKYSNGRGTLFINWGYNRSIYSQSDIRFKGRVYDFTLKGVRAEDNQSKKISEFLQASNFTIPQYNFKAGYYFRNKYALSFSFDKMKYLINNANQVLIEGYVNEGVDSILSGNYSNQQIVTNSSDFHYENQVNYFRFDINRTEKLYQNQAKNFAISFNAGLGIGFTVNSADFNFESNYTRNTVSLSGIGISAQGSFRFEFFKNFFIQGELSGGSIQQNKLKTRTFDNEIYANQQFWYGQRAIYAGVLIYFKPVNGCNDCPVW